MSEYQHELRNWWCPKCKEWLASCDIDLAQRHRECYAKVEWRRYEVTCFDEGKHDAKAIGT